MSVRSLRPPYSTVASLVATTIICVGCAVPVPPQNQRAPVGPRPTSEAPTGETPRQRVAREAKTQARVNGPSTQSPSAQTPRRYTLNIDDLISKNEGGEIETIGPFSLSDRPTPLTVMRQVGYQGQWTNVPLPGLESRPPYLNCVYQMIDRSNPKNEDVITRDVKFWYGQRPAIASVAVYSDLIGMKIADVAVERCPNNWGEALTTAMGQEIRSKVKTRPNPNAPKAKPEPIAVAGGVPAQGARAPLPAALPAPAKVPDGRALSAIEKCDKSASHPDDPEAFSQGVSDEQLNEEFVITACEEAVKMDKNSPRLAFQLARGYLKSNRVEDAVEQLLNAAKKGHGASLAYLADIHLDGAPGIEADPNLARSLYEKAVQSGFVAAKKILAEFEDYTEKVAAAEREEAMQDKQDAQSAASAGKLPKPKLLTPKLIENIMSKKFADIDIDERYAKSYLVTVAETLQEECNAHYTPQEIKELKSEFSKIRRIGTGIGFSGFDFSNLGQAQLALQRAMAAKENLRKAMGDRSGYADEDAELGLLIDDIPINAMNDGFYLILKHGCGSSQLDLFKKNASSFFTNEWAPEYPLTTSIERVCEDAASKAGEADIGRERCECYATANALNPISQATRKALYSDYWSVTKRLIKQKPARYSGCS